VRDVRPGFDLDDFSLYERSKHWSSSRSFDLF
jgi:hypothetical protein